MFFSTKRIGPISTGHRQWRDDGHCAWLHGYARYIQFTFAGELDHRQWVVDFGDLKDVKARIEDTWDHKFLIASDDPHLEEIRALEQFNVIRVSVMDVEQGHGPGIEGSCKWVYDTINPMILEKTGGRACISKVEIWEHENNTAVYMPDPKPVDTTWISNPETKLACDNILAVR